MKKIIYIISNFVFIPFAIGILFFISVMIGAKYNKKKLKPNIVWGPIPILNNAYWSKALSYAGFNSKTYTYNYYGVINNRNDWDEIVSEKYKYFPSRISCFIAFAESLFKYDVFVIPFSGYFLGITPIWMLESVLLKLAKKKIIVIPYGSDAYVYRNIRSTTAMHGLLISYPDASRKQNSIFRKVSYWCKNADFVIPSGMGPDGFGRWDVLLPNSLNIDLDLWKESKRSVKADGVSEIVYVAHAPNHRGIKGTEFIVDSINKLKADGLKIELIMIEKKQNIEVRKLLNEKVDILVDQLIFTGHGLNALEGMASGLPTISNLEDDSYTAPFRRWSYLNECPLVSAEPETLTDVLRKLVTQPELRQELGKAGREYVEKYHGLDSAQYLFGEVIKYLYGRRDSLINLYHPILGEYPNRSPKVEHPLVNNKIIT